MSQENAVFSDEQMMLLMAYADGELDGDELATVEALLRDNTSAREWMDGFSATKAATLNHVMADEIAGDLADVTARTSAQTEAAQLMAYVDGELSEAQIERGQLDNLLQATPAARNWVNDLRLAKQALHDDVMQPDMQADLSMIRGRVMRKLPAEPRASVAEKPKGLFPTIAAWLADLGMGKTVIAAGAMAAVLLLAISIGKVGNSGVNNSGVGAPVGDGPVMSNAAGTGTLSVAEPADGEPEVIIEEMESDGGTVIFEGGSKAGEAVIIWHIDPTEQGAG